MNIASYRVTDRKCATCRWWSGRRMVEFRANKPFYVKVDAEAADCLAQKRTCRFRRRDADEECRFPEKSRFRLDAGERRLLWTCRISGHTAEIVVYYMTCARRRRRFDKDRNREMTRKLMVLLAAAVAVAIGARAETETVGGYTWTYRINGDTAEDLI